MPSGHDSHTDADQLIQVRPHVDRLGLLPPIPRSVDD